MRTIRLVVTGLGNLGRRFLEIILDKDVYLSKHYNLKLSVVGVADSRGVAYNPNGLDIAAIVQCKQAGSSVGTLPGVGRMDWDALSLVKEADADILLEAMPVNLKQGAEPALSCIRTALQKGLHVVTPNKGPLVVAYAELHELAKQNGVQLRFDGTVAGGLPAINLGSRDLRGAVVYRLEAVPNLVTGYVMDMLSQGLTWDEAKAKARQEGVLEADPSWDLEGWDAVAKLVILANSVLGIPAKMEDVTRTGITHMDVDELSSALERNYRYRLLARAELRDNGGYNLSVAPVPLSSEHPLGRLGQKQMGVVYHTDIYGTITAIIDEPNPVPSAATMLRDLLDIYVSL